MVSFFLSFFYQTLMNVLWALTVVLISARTLPAHSLAVAIQDLNWTPTESRAVVGAH